MWQACRAAALQQLARGSSSSSTPLRLHTAAGAINAHATLRRTPSAVASVVATGQQQEQWGHARFHSSPSTCSSHREEPLKVHGISLVSLAKRSRRDVEDEFGADVLRRARQALPQLWDDLLEGEDQQQEQEEHEDSDGDMVPPVSRDAAKQLFMAALKQQLPQLALSVFEYMDAAFPTQVDFVVYGEVFTLLTRAGKTDETLAVFERNKPLYTDDRPAPELIYRFGVFGKLGKKDFGGVEELLDEMQSVGIELSNELKSRLMIAYAKSGDRDDQVMELYASLDPQKGRWHEADVDRVINSLGFVGCADEAFEFYRNAQIKLTGNTILALLNVCRANDRPRHAMAILANRKRFHLVLNAREYNKVLETLEQFGELKEIPAILDEMAHNRVRFDKLTKAIVARNQHALQGTAYDTSGSYHQSYASSVAVEGRGDGDNYDGDSDTVADLKLSEVDTRRKMQELNASKAFTMAAGLADMHLTPLTSELEDSLDDAGGKATTITPFLAAEAIAAYANSGAHEKVAALLKGFSSVKGEFGHALTYMISFYSKQKNHAMIYGAFKASQFQERDIYRVKEALECFVEFQDADAALKLFHQTCQQVDAALAKNGNDLRKLKHALSFDRSNVVKMTLQVLVETRRLDDVVAVLETLEAQGFRTRTSDYTTILRVMREQQDPKSGVAVYQADDFEKLWTDMTQRGVQPSKAILAHSCVALAAGTTAQQQLVLDAYAQVKDGQDDSYNLPPVCYSSLLRATAMNGSLGDVELLFDAAVRSLQEAKKSNPKIRFFPRDWVSTLVAKLASFENGDSIDSVADAAFQQVKKMKKHCGGYAYDALVPAMRVCALASNKSSEVAQLKAMFVEAKCRLTLSDAEQLVRVATEKRSVELAMLAIQLFDQGNVLKAIQLFGQGNVVKATAETKATNPKSETSSTLEPKKNTIGAFQLQRKPSALVLKKICAMYDTALELSEQHGANKSGKEDMAALLKARTSQLAQMK